MAKAKKKQQAKKKQASQKPARPKAKAKQAKPKAEEAKPKPKPKAKAEEAKPKVKAKAKAKAEEAKPKVKAKEAKAKEAKAKEAKAKEAKAKAEEAKPKRKPPAKAAEPAVGETFAGFPEDAFLFLAELALNNEREWFEANKDRYEQSVREPALAFIRAMRPRLQKIAPHFVCLDKKTGGSLMRINRDVRFSTDKSPYKTNIGIHFRHEAKGDVHAPGFYVHVAPDSCFVGIGMWGPEPPALAKIRARIDAEPKTWTKAIGGKKFAEAFTRGGESLKRPPKGYAEDHPFVDDLKRKHHIATANLEPAQLQESKAVERIATLFAAGSDYIRFQCEALGVPY